MTPATHANRFARGTRFGVVDVVLLSIPVTAIVALLMPLLLSVFYYGPMAKQEGVYTVSGCERSSSEEGEAGFSCTGVFLPDDGSEPVTRRPHVFVDVGKILESGDDVALTLYENDSMVLAGDVPVLYEIFWTVGGAFGFVGIIIIASYLARWLRSGRRTTAEETPTSLMTRLPIQENGWDAEHPVLRKFRMGWIGLVLLVCTLGAMVGFGVAIGAQLQRTGVAHAAGVMTVESCEIGTDLDSNLRVPVYCLGTFRPNAGEAGNVEVMPAIIGLYPWSHKEYEPGERVAVEVYEDGIVKDDFGPDPAAIPGMVWGIAFGFAALLAGGVWWLSLAAVRTSRIRR